MTSEIKVSDVLKRARSRIQRGWTQGALQRERPFPLSLIFPVQYCAVGAIVVDAGWLECFGATGVEILDTLRRAAAFAAGDEHLQIDDYNDAPGRTKQHVLAVYDIAIADAEAKERAT